MTCIFKAHRFNAGYGLFKKAQLLDGRDEVFLSPKNQSGDMDGLRKLSWVERLDL